METTWRKEENLSVLELYLDQLMKDITKATNATCIPLYKASREQDRFRSVQFFPICAIFAVISYEAFHLQLLKCSSLVAQWLSVPGDHGSNLGGGEKNFSFF